MDTRQKEIWKKKFADFTAIPVMNNEDFFAFDWQGRNGACGCSIRYILDIRKGDLIITGDFGYAIASWYRPVTPEDMYRNVDDIGYFSGKLLCSSDKYTYSPQDIREDLERIREKLIGGGFDKESVDHNFDDLRLYFNAVSPGEGIPYPQPVSEILEKYDPEWYRNPDFCNIGKRLSPRIYGWTAGFRMAGKQLGLGTE